MKVLTANRLIDGEAVWLAPGDIWAETLDAADVAQDKAAEDLLELAARRWAQKNEVVDINLIDVVVAGGIIRPTRLREQIRADGPTNRRDLGKQARRLVAA